MAQKGRRNADDQLRLALACGATVEAAARQAGVSPRTVYRRLEDPAFRRAVADLRIEMIQRTAATLTAAGGETVKALVALLAAAEPGPVRLGAAKAILEIGIKFREVADLEQRLAALEAQLATPHIAARESTRGRRRSLPARPRTRSSQAANGQNRVTTTETPMPVLASFRKKLARLEHQVAVRARSHAPVLDAIRADPTVLLTASGMTPDDWQKRALTTDGSRMLLLASRQAGKSQVAAALALGAALLKPKSPVLLLSPTQRQSGELFRKILDLFNARGRPVGVLSESALRLELANGSRILSLPGTEANVRCFSGVSMLLIDEAARVADALYYSVRPMLAVSQGRLVALSTPFGKRGFFHDAWFSSEAWERVKITADQCPRITPEFLAEERRALGERWYFQEYCCDFSEVIDAVFSYADIQAALSDDVQPFFPAR